MPNLLVFRDGLEAILVLAALTASFVGANRSLHKPPGFVGLCFATFPTVEAPSRRSAQPAS